MHERRIAMLYAYEYGFDSTVAGFGYVTARDENDAELKAEARVPCSAWYRVWRDDESSDMAETIR